MDTLLDQHRRDKEKCHLLIYIEPTPYILALVSALQQESVKPAKTLFLCQDLTQSWGLSLENLNAELLSVQGHRAIKQIWQNIAAKPAILHLAGWGHPLLLFALIAGWLLHVPVVMESDTQLPVDQPVWKRMLKRLIFPLLFRIPKILLPGGSRQAAYFKFYGVEDNRLQIANMTVDVASIKDVCEMSGESVRQATRSRLNVGTANVLFLFVGRLVAYKGLQDLLSAFGRLSLQRPEARLLIVGDGPLRDLVADAVASNNAICYAGRLPMSGVIEMCHAADVAVVPSFFEPWGLVVNEAMAAGLPVIASDRVGAVGDLVVNGVTGKVFTAGHILELLAAMTELLDEQVRHQLSAAACELIDEWTLEKSAKKIIQAWQRAECDE